MQTHGVVTCAGAQTGVELGKGSKHEKTTATSVLYAPTNTAEVCVAARAVL